MVLVALPELALDIVIWIENWRRAVILMELMSSCMCVGRTGHSMDKKSPCKEVSEEQARESLISISNSLPDKFLSLDNTTEDTKGVDDIAVKDGNEAEKYISELISISNCQSQDVLMSPSVPLANHKE